MSDELGLALLEYIATGEGRTFLAFTGSKSEALDWFGDYFAIGMVFKTDSEWLALDSKSDLSKQEEEDFCFLQVFKDECPNAWTMFSMGRKPSIAYRFHYNVS